MKLPQKLSLPDTQTTWAAAIEPVLNMPQNQGVLLQDLKLKTGLNVINHRLGRKLQGWYTTRVRAAVTFYDTQDTNQTPDLTLNLMASGPCTINLMVF